MYTYHIKHNGYTIGQANGKKEAIDRIKKELAWEGVSDAKWKIGKNTAVVQYGNNEYTIERA